MITTPRTFVNKTGVTYNAARTQTIFAEDMNLLGDNDIDLQDQIDNLDFATEAYVDAAVAVETAARIADVNAEEAARIAAVSAEATTRGNADTTLTNNLNTEITNRQNGDTAQQNYTDSMIGNYTTQLKSIVRVEHDNSSNVIAPSSIDIIHLGNVIQDTLNSWAGDPDWLYVCPDDGTYQINFGVLFEFLEKGYYYRLFIENDSSEIIAEARYYTYDDITMEMHASTQVHLAGGQRIQLKFENPSGTDVNPVPDMAMTFMTIHWVSY